MHAPIGAVEFGDKAKQFERAEHKWVEQTHLNIGVGIHGRKGLIQATGAMVINQHAHAHTALSRFVQGFQQQRAGGVAMPNVILHIQGFLGLLGQLHPRRKRFTRVRQQIQAA